MTDTNAEKPEARPRIDLSPALGEGGHEVEDLGYEGVADTGPVLGTEQEPRDADAALDIAAVEFGTD